MLANTEWLGTVECSAKSLERLGVTADDALVVRLRCAASDDADETKQHKYASSIVRPIPVSSPQHMISVHPILYDFMAIAASEGASNDGDAIDGVKCCVQALPLCPPPLECMDAAMSNRWSISKTTCQRMSSQYAYRIHASCIHMDDCFTSQGLPQNVLEDLILSMLDGRIIHSQTTVAVANGRGCIFLFVDKVHIGKSGNMEQTMDVEDWLSAIRVSTHSSDCKLHLNARMPDDWNADAEAVSNVPDTSPPATSPGYEDQLEAILQLLNLTSDQAAPSGILLTGFAGVGKTRFISCIAQRYHKAKQKVHRKSAHDLFVAATSTDDLLDSALPQNGKCDLFIIDDLHLLAQDAGHEDVTPADHEFILVHNTILEAIDILQQRGSAVVGVAQTRNALPHTLTKAGRLEKEIELLPPSQAQRVAIWQHLLDDIDHVKPQVRTNWAVALSRASAGCVAKDICAIFQDAMTRGASRKHGGGTANGDETQLQWNDLQEAAMGSVPSQLMELDVRKPMVWSTDISWSEMHHQSWKKFAGYSEVKQRTYRNVVLPWKGFLQNLETEMQQPIIIAPPTGVLFHGPSGCGKSLAARCLANSLGLPMIQVRATDVLDKWLGGSEALLRSLFARARSVSPCILFIDEIDAIASNRSEDDGNDFTSRVLSTFLNEMDGVSSGLSKNQILVIACTNRLEALDSALLRPGRLGDHFLLQHPNADELMQIMRHYLSEVPLHDDVQLDELSAMLHQRQFSGANVEGLCRDVCLSSFSLRDTDDNFMLQRRDFLRHLQ